MFENIVNKKPDQKVQKGLNRWVPTNYGNFPDVRIRPDSKTSAYMTMHEVGIEPDDNSQKTHLWVYDISFNWTMNYQQSQTVFGKSFYPRHMQVGNVIVKCQTASQHHYDELVNMILDYQQNAVLAEVDNKYVYKIVRFEIPEAKYQIDSTPRPYDRVAKPLSDKNAIYKYDRIWFDGYPISIAAGHTKSVYQPELELSFAVLSYKNDLDIVSRIQSQAKPSGDPFANDAIQNVFQKNIDPNNSVQKISSTSAALQAGYTELPNGTPRDW